MRSRPRIARKTLPRPSSIPLLSMRGTPMRLRLAFLALALAIAVIVTGTGARGGEVTTIDGETVKADVVSITSTDITYKVGNKEIKTPIAKILKVDFREPDKVPENKEFSQIELTDGTIVFASTWAMKG